MNKIAVLSGLSLVLGIAVGCSSSKSSSSGGGDSGAGGDSGTTVCNSIAQLAPTIQQSGVATVTPPAGTGGTITTGRYYLTADTPYNASPAGPTGISESVTFEITSTGTANTYNFNYNFFIDEGGASEGVTQNSTLVITAPNQFTTTQTCPTVSSPSIISGTYTATSTSIVLTIAGSSSTPYTWTLTYQSSN